MEKRLLSGSSFSPPASREENETAGNLLRHLFSEASYGQGDARARCVRIHEYGAACNIALSPCAGTIIDQVILY